MKNVEVLSEKTFWVFVFSQCLLGCLSSGGDGSSTVPKDTAPNSYLATYTYPLVNLNPGDGTVDVSATAIEKCVDANTSKEVAVSNCPPLSKAPKKIYRSPAGTVEVSIPGAIGGKVTVAVDLGELFDKDSLSGQTKISDVLVCDNLFEKSGATCSIALLRAKKISLGTYGTCAITLDDKVKCFGSNDSGRFGLGDKVTQTIPKEVLGYSGAKSISLGDSHSCAIMSDSKVKCAGKNDYGQLGVGDTTERLTPIEVSGFYGAKEVTIGVFHTCAIMADNTVKCTGRGDGGTLGLGNYNHQVNPTEAPGFAGATALALGSGFTCALMSDLKVKCTGVNGYGILSLDGFPGYPGTYRNLPIEIPDLNGVVGIAAGFTHTCTLIQDGSVKCLGRNGNYQFGDGTTNPGSTPVTITGFANATKIIAGGSTCAIMSDNKVKCAGWNTSGELGVGNQINQPTPIYSFNSEAVKSVAQAFTHICSIMADDKVKCSGTNTDGELGDSNVTSSEFIPVYVVKGI